MKIISLIKGDSLLEVVQNATDFADSVRTKGKYAVIIASINYWILSGKDVTPKTVRRLRSKLLISEKEEKWIVQHIRELKHEINTERIEGRKVEAFDI